MDTTLSGVEIAKLTAIIVGGNYKRSNSKGAAIKRFENACGAAGIQGPKMFLTETFDDAQKMLAPHEGKANGAAVVEAKPKPKPKVKKPAKAKAERAPGKRAAIEADARSGKLPKAPDFSAETHKRFRPKLTEVVDLAKAGDLKGLKAVKINPVSSSPKAIARYRDLAVMALEAKG